LSLEDQNYRRFDHVSNGRKVDVITNADIQGHERKNMDRLLILKVGNKWIISTYFWEIPSSSSRRNTFLLTYFELLTTRIERSQICVGLSPFM
jgi:hypothetical protein